MKRDLDAAIDIIKNNNYYDIDKYSPVYSFTNENEEKLANPNVVGGMKICTVLGSGDQVFNMLLGDPTSIKTFDINILTKYLFYLKKATILAFNYDDYVSFYFKNGLFNYNLLSKDKYNIIRQYIDNDDALLFWDTLFNLYNGKSLYNSNLFYKDYAPYKNHRIHNPYLKHWTLYNELKKKLKDFELDFVHSNVLEDNNISDDIYDFIYLSNIFDHVFSKSEEEFVKKVTDTFNKLFNNLDDKGKIVCYLFNYVDDNEKRVLSSELMRIKYFEGMFKYDRVDSLISPGSNRYIDKDAFLVCNKKRVLKNEKRG